MADDGSEPASGRGAWRGERPPAMTDVARLAGVSHQTVSRVLNDHPSVRSATRATVLAAVAALGYRPNSTARALVTGRSRVVGVITVAGTLHGPASTLYGIEAAARAAGYSVTVTALQADEALDQLDAMIARLEQQGVDGVVVLVPLASPDASRSAVRERHRTPVVAVAGTASDLPVVTIDDEAGARLATAHLLGLGHPTVHHVAGPPGWIEAGQRRRGWSATLAEAGRAQHPPLVGDWSAGSGYLAGRELAADPGVSAVYAANDQMALGVLRAMGEQGRRVPQDVSVVGTDDMPEAGYLAPPLTTIGQHFDQVGRRSLDVLLAEIEGSDVDLETVLLPDLVVRASTAPYGASS